jgi:hypothetical protein
MIDFASMVRCELDRARRKHASAIHSAAEGYAVILEEVDEFWDEVRKQSGARSLRDMLTELVQIGAMAQRCAEDLHLVDAESRGNGGAS